ncbi:hypothetical protein [Sandaracinus amylolyticus]|uniref:hypothetical protein n=1 Tax=Sandaracinus amylolyticus TaxID=927083 RepID=UPI001F21AD84|nr:hypothetical protein [Sandaracinus amylolyticus]UJR84764.1 Hypothetical protein I5071_68430 [Sandaracinus amylolyticus]
MHFGIEGKSRGSRVESARPAIETWSAIARRRHGAAVWWSQRASLASSFVALALGCGTAPSTEVDATVPVVQDAARDDDAGASDPIDASAPPSACACFDGEGSYCEASVAARAAAEGCVVDGARADGARVFACDASGWRAGEACAHGCEIGETGASAACALPECECFVVRRERGAPRPHARPAVPRPARGRSRRRHPRLRRRDVDRAERL